MAENNTLTIDNAKKLAWNRGLLSFMLLPHQHVIYNAIWNAINNPSCIKHTLNCARRFGKSTTLCIVSLEFAIRNPNSMIRFATGTNKALRKITNPIFKQLLTDCPLDLRPVFNSNDGIWSFKNGSEIHLSGCEGGSEERLRGQNSNLNIVDECGFISGLDYVLSSILVPQTLTTNGKTILASTPPRSPSHPFLEIAKACELSGNYNKFTIYDNTSISQESIALYAKEAGGFDSTTWKREYLCEWITEETAQIVPEWNDSFIEEPTIVTTSPFYDRYVSMDLGVRDYTAVIFGHYDFLKAAFYVEDELTLSGVKLTTQTIVNEIKIKEQLIFNGLKPHKRISDNNNLMLISDLNYLHQLPFTPTSKESLESMINELRVMVASGRIKVSPKCKMTIGCLRYGVWDERNKMFARSNTYGHFDHLAALVYLVRNLDKNHNPIPKDLNISISTHHINVTQEQLQTSHNIQQLSSLFKKTNSSF